MQNLCSFVQIYCDALYSCGGDGFHPEGDFRASIGVVIVYICLARFHGHDTAMCCVFRSAEEPQEMCYGNQINNKSSPSRIIYPMAIRVIYRIVQEVELARSERN